MGNGNGSGRVKGVRKVNGNLLTDRAALKIFFVPAVPSDEGRRPLLVTSGLGLDLTETGIWDLRKPELAPGEYRKNVVSRQKIEKAVGHPIPDVPPETTFVAAATPEEIAPDNIEPVRKLLVEIFKEFDVARLGVAVGWSCGCGLTNIDEAVRRAAEYFGTLPVKVRIYYG